MTTIDAVIHPLPATAKENPPARPACAVPDLESLRRGDIDTVVSPLVARTMVVLFMLGICAVPAIQALWEVKKGEAPQALDVLRPPARAAKSLVHGNLRDSVNQLRWWASKEHLTKFEGAVNDRSVFKKALRPHLQYALSRYGQFGDTMSIIARDRFRPNGWLFYQLGLDYVAGPPFLDPAFIKRQEKLFADEGHANVNCDPRKAIIQFHRDCQRHGVHLVYVPIPTKPMIQPAELSPRLAFSSPIPTPNNPDYPRFIAELRAAGVDVFDPTPRELYAGWQLYLRQDTHWTPQWMEEVAAAVAEHVKQKVALPPARDFGVQVVQIPVSHIGDIADALHLPEGQTLFPEQTVMLNRVVDAKTGQPRGHSVDADVIVLGDSFTNIYSEPKMLWGDSAGFSEQISRFLNRDVDVIARNGLAAEVVRAELAKRETPLRGKRVIIWEVTMHELTCSHWPVLPIP